MKSTRSGKHNVDADSLSRIKWHESVDDVVTNRNNIAEMNSQVVHEICQGKGIPYRYVQTVSKSAKVITESYVEDSEAMTLDKWKVEQGKDPTLHFLIQHLQEGVLLKRKTSQLELKCPEIRPYLKSLKQLQLHDGLYRKMFSDKTGKQAHLLQLVLPSLGPFKKKKRFKELNKGMIGKQNLSS